MLSEVLFLKPPFLCNIIYLHLHEHGDAREIHQLFCQHLLLTL